MRVRQNISLPTELRDAVHRLAHLDGVTFSRIVSDAIVMYAERRGADVPPLVDARAALASADRALGRMEAESERADTERGAKVV